MLSNLHVINDETIYKNLRWKFIKEFEGNESSPYLDNATPDQKVTIGVGFNIEDNDKLRDLVLDKLGLTRTLLTDIKCRDDLTVAIRNAANGTSKTTLKTTLDNILKDRFNSLTAAQKLTDIVKKSFTLTDDESRDIFDKICDGVTGADPIVGFEQQLDTLLGSKMANSNERIALLSMKYNGVLTSTESPTLVADIKNGTGNRTDAWYQIRYQSNATKDPGITKRRYAEAQLFGLYNSSISPEGVSAIEAQSVIAMYNTHHADITAYEAQYGLAKSITSGEGMISPLVAANKNLVTIGLKNPTNSSLSLSIDTLGQVLKPVTKYLLQASLPTANQIDFNVADKTAAQMAAEVSGDVVFNFNTPYHGLGNYHTANDMLAITPVYVTAYDKSPTTETNLPAGITGINDVLIGFSTGKNQLAGLYGNDTLIGGNECDLLVGGYASIQGDSFDSHDPRFVNSGDDKLYGLGGNDNLIGQDGNDVLDGGEGNDHLWGDAGNDQLRGGAGDDTLEGGSERDALYGGTGYDIYEFNTPYGTADNYFGGDTIIDEDNKGAIFINGNQVGTFHQTMAGGSNTYQSSYGIATLLNGSATFGGDLVIGGSVIGGSYNSITIINWRPGALGIRLDETVTLNAQELHLIPPPPPPKPPKLTNPVSPLVLDLDGDGIETLSTNAGIYFDHAGDGFRELTGWVAADDGLLVLDRNGDGKITSGKELFGNNTAAGDFGFPAKNGFDALKDLDTNNDNMISASDTPFDDLRVWRDLNQNGESETNELFTLSALQINRISLNYTTQETGDYLGNVFRQTSNYTTNTISRSITDVWFDADVIQRKEESLPVSASIAALPDAQGFGQVFSLRQAMVRDNTGTLQNLVTQFKNASTSQERMALLDSILFAWTGQSLTNKKFVYIDGIRLDAPVTSLADLTSIPFDGRKLNVLNAFYGQDISLPSNINNSFLVLNDFARTYDAAYAELADTVFYQLASQTYLKPIFDQITWTKNDSSKDIVWLANFNNVPTFLLQYFQNNSGNAQDILVDFKRALGGLNPGSNLNQTALSTAIQNYLLTTNLSAYSGKTIGLVSALAQDLLGNNFSGDSKNNYLFGLSGNDTIQGMNGDDYIDGGIGDDFITGDFGSDTLVGGKGNDRLLGGSAGDSGSGNDLYQYAPGDDNDIIYDAAGVNRLEFTRDILQAQISITHDAANLYIILNNGDTITFEGASNALGNLSPNTLGSIKFSDGVIWNSARIQQELLSNPNRLVSGTDGKDTLYGGIGKDTLLGGKSDDILYAGTGGNTLVGGKGNDQLMGGISNEIYQYHLGDGNDVITETDGIDRIEFDAQILESQVTLERVGVDLVVHINSSESITVVNMYDPNAPLPSPYVIQDRHVLVASHAIESIQFATGAVWNLAYILDQTNDGLILNGTSDNDSITGTDANDIFESGKGNDTLSGDKGNDVYKYTRGDGYDTIKEFGGIDTILFQQGITPESIKVTFSGDGLFVYVDNVASIYIEGMLDWKGNLVSYQAIDNFSFSNGDSWDLNKIIQMSQLKTAGNDWVTAFNFNDVIDGGEGNDYLDGAGGSDIIIGGLGNDTLYGNNNRFNVATDFTDTDILIGGEGDDYLYGSVGNDVYRFGKNDGNDHIDDAGGSNDRIEFIDGITAQDVVVKNDYGLKINVNNGTVINFDSMLDQYTGAITDHSIEKIIFSNGQEWAIEDIRQHLKTEGSSGNDQFSGMDGDDVLNGFDGDDELRGLDGNDTLLGGNGNDYLVGGQGNNVLDGAAGNDTFYEEYGSGNNIFIGGKGNDVIWGGLGDDIYKYNLGDGNDQIIEMGGFDTIELGSGINLNSIRLEQDYGTLLINFSSGGRIDVSRFFDGQVHESIKFSNGDIWDLNTLWQRQLADNVAPNQPTAAFDATGKVITGIAEAGCTVEIKNSSNTTSLGTAIADIATGAYVITLTTALINKQIVNITAKDAAGNISAAKAIVAPDKTAPTQPTAAFDTTGKIITGVAEAGSTVEVKNGGNTASLGTIVANATTGAYSITLTTALINKETVNVTAKDVAGNVSTAKAIVAPDKTAPTQPTAAFDTTGKIITGVAEAGSTVEVKNSDNTASLGTIVANATTGTYSITLITALLNKETVNVTAKDVAGNISVVKSITAPDKTAPLQPTAAFNTAGKIISGVAEADSRVYFKDAAGNALGDVKANASTGAYQFTLTTALLNHEVVSASAKDAAGNYSALTFVTAPDTTAPTQPTAAFDTTGKIITGIAEAGSIVEVKNSANTATLGSIVANATTGSYSITLTTALINNETVNVTAKDAAGNTSIVNAIIAPLVTGDTTPPAQPTGAFDSAGKIITGVAEKGSTISVKNAASVEIGSATANITTGAYSVTLVTALINKEIVNVSAKDASGNVSIVKSLTAPDKTPPAQPTAAFNTAGTVISGVAEADSRVYFKNADGSTLGDAKANATTGAYRFTLTTALVNNEVISASAKDAAGNYSAAISVTAPLVVAAKVAAKTVKVSAPASSEAQVDNLIQAMAAFAPPAAAESKVLVGYYYDAHPMLVSHS